MDRKNFAGTVERGVEQTLGYMAKCGAEKGHLVVIDRRSVTEGSRHGEGESRRDDGDDGAEGGGRRQGVVVRTL